MGKRIGPLLLLALLLLAGTARAAEDRPELPLELARAAPEAAELAEDGLLAGLEALVEEALAGARDYLLSGVRSVALIMAGVTLLGVVESTSPAGKDVLGRYVSMAGALWITAVSAGDLNALMGLGERTISQMALLGKALLPALAAAEAAAGGITAAAVKQAAAVFFSDVLLTLIQRLLLPMVRLYVGVAAAGAVLEGDAMEHIGSLLKKAIGWALSGLLVLFTGYLTLSGAVAGAADAQTVKAAKAAVSAAVPVVGGILASAAESVVAGAGLLRGLVGTCGTLAVVGLCLLPVLRLGCQYLLYQGASLVAAAAGPKKLTGLLGQLAEAFSLVLAMTAASAVALLIAITASLTAAV